MSTREECEYLRERMAAGLSDDIASCALHGAYGVSWGMRGPQSAAEYSA
jgi:hypothetical protein